MYSLSNNFNPSEDLMRSPEFQDLCDDVHSRMRKLLSNNEEAIISHCRTRDSKSLRELVKLLMCDSMLSDLKQDHLEAAIQVSLLKISVPCSYVEQPTNHF